MRENQKETGPGGGENLRPAAGERAAGGENSGTAAETGRREQESSGTAGGKGHAKSADFGAAGNAAAVKLSPRLALIASFVNPGSRPADIGTDHGYIPIWLVQTGRCPGALAMDVRNGPLERAAAHVRRQGLEGKIELRLSDGLEKLGPGEADTIIIAGMGGELICRILERGRRLWEGWREGGERLVLSPQSEIGDVRRFLAENGFALLQEAMIRDEGKYYVVMEAARGQMRPLRDAEYTYGPLLIRSGDGTLREYLKKERSSLEAICASLEREAGALRGENTEADGGARIESRIRQLRRRLEEIEEAEYEMQCNHSGAGGTGAALHGL